MGAVRILPPVIVVIQEPVAVEMETSQPVPTDNNDNDLCAEASDSDDFESQLSVQQPHTAMPIKVNPKAGKSGRPALNRRVRATDIRQDRVTFNAAQSQRRTLGDVTMAALIASLDSEQSTTIRTLSRSAPIPTKLEEHASKKPKLNAAVNPVVNLDIFYLLPSKVLDACMQLLPLANEPENAINLISQDDGTGESSKRLVEIVSIVGVGAFSRDQFEAMRRIETLRNTCDESSRFCGWLQRDVPRVLSVAEAWDARNLIIHVSSVYPESIV